MKVLEVCTNYFYGFQDITRCKQNDVKTNALAEQRLLELVDKSKLPLLNEQFEYRFNFNLYNDLELELLHKYGKELSLSEEGIKQIKEYLEHIKALCEKTIDKPLFVYG